jgi:predicted nucleic acid-binding protein
MLARGVMEWIFVHDIKSFVAPQVLAEYWAVATRPANQRGGLGLSIEAVQQDIRHFMELHRLAREPSNLLKVWLDLLWEYKVTGRSVWDARLAAVLRANNIEHILTFNTVDFRRFDFLRVVHPEELQHQMREPGGAP